MSEFIFQRFIFLLAQILFILQELEWSIMAFIIQFNNRVRCHSIQRNSNLLEMMPKQKKFKMEEQNKIKNVIIIFAIFLLSEIIITLFF